MKLSLKFHGDGDEDQHSTQIMTAKVPITVLNNPFISGVKATTTTTSESSEFSFSLSTNFPTGPAFKLSYSPTASSLPPFSLSLKSGLGISGSPRHSPLIFSANLSLSLSPTTNTLTPIPSFFLHFKPQLGHFSLNKTVFSDTNTDPLSPSTAPPPDHHDSQIGGKGFVVDRSSGWQELKLEPYPAGDRDAVPERSLTEKSSAKYGLSSRVAVMAKTAVPLTQGLFLNFRWGVNFPRDLGLKLPYLTVSKIGLERVVEEVKQGKKNQDTSADSDKQLLKGVCFWMKRDLENVEKENREMKRVLEEMKMGVSSRSYREGSNGNARRKLTPQSGESYSEFQRRGSGKSDRQENEKKQQNISQSEFQRRGSGKSDRQENEKKQQDKSQSVASDLEAELQRAIKAASS